MAHHHTMPYLKNLVKYLTSTSHLLRHQVINTTRLLFLSHKFSVLRTCGIEFARGLSPGEGGIMSMFWGEYMGIRQILVMKFWDCTTIISRRGFEPRSQIGLSELLLWSVSWFLARFCRLCVTGV